MCVKVGQWKLANRRITIAADPGTISEFQSEIVPGSRDSEFHMLLTVFLSKLNTPKLHLFNWLRNAINDLNVMQNSESVPGSCFKRVFHCTRT